MRCAAGLSKPTLLTAPTRSGGNVRACRRNSNPSFSERDSSTDHGTTVAFNHQDSAHANTPTSQTGASNRPKPTPAARIAVSSFARCNFPRVNSNDTRSASGSTTVRKLGMVTKKYVHNSSPRAPPSRNARKSSYITCTSNNPHVANNTSPRIWSHSRKRCRSNVFTPASKSDPAAGANLFLGPDPALDQRRDPSAVLGQRTFIRSPVVKSSSAAQFG